MKVGERLYAGDIFEDGPPPNHEEVMRRVFERTERLDGVVLGPATRDRQAEKEDGRPGMIVYSAEILEIKEPAHG